MRKIILAVSLMPLSATAVEWSCALQTPTNDQTFNATADTMPGAYNSYTLDPKIAPDPRVTQATDETGGNWIDGYTHPLIDAIESSFATNARSIRLVYDFFGASCDVRGEVVNNVGKVSSSSGTCTGVQNANKGPGIWGTNIWSNGVSQRTTAPVTVSFTQSYTLDKTATDDVQARSYTTDSDMQHPTARTIDLTIQATTAAPHYVFTSTFNSSFSRTADGSVAYMSTVIRCTRAAPTWSLNLAPTELVFSGAAGSNETQTETVQWQIQSSEGVTNVPGTLTVSWSESGADLGGARISVTDIFGNPVTPDVATPNGTGAGALNVTVNPSTAVPGEYAGAMTLTYLVD